MSSLKKLIQIGTNFWNIRGSFNFLFGLVDIGTHMSLIKLPTGKFLVVDTCAVTPDIKSEIDSLTDNGNLIEAVIATHPFHTVYFVPFQKLYPNTKYYGTPRHIRKITEINWDGDVSSPELLNKWESEGVFMRIPDGFEFNNPVESDHVSSLFLFHAASKTIHVDDTVFYFTDPGFVLRCSGAKHNSMSFHAYTTKYFLPDPNSPLHFKAWLEKLIDDWDFDNLCSAHNSYKIGGAKVQLIETLTKFTPTLEKIAAKKNLDAANQNQNKA
jgi:hypothetical protein